MITENNLPVTTTPLFCENRTQFIAKYSFLVIISILLYILRHIILHQILYYTQVHYTILLFLVLPTHTVLKYICQILGGLTADIILFILINIMVYK